MAVSLDPESGYRPVPEKPSLSAYPKFLTEDLSEENALPWQRYFDESITGGGGLIDEQIGRTSHATDSSGYLDKTLNLGLKDAPQLQATGFGFDSPMSEALAKKYSARVADGIKSIKTQGKIDRGSQVSKALGVIGNEIGASEKLRIQNFKEQYQYQQQRQQVYNQWVMANDAARAQFWGQVLGLAGTAAAAL